MVPAIPGHHGPLVAEIRNESAGVVIGGRRFPHQPPLGFVQRGVVLRVSDEIESRFVPGKAHEVVDGADAFRVTGVTVGISPEDSKRRILNDEDRVRIARDGAVCRSDREPVRARLVEREFQHDNGLGPGRDRNNHLPVVQNVESRDVTRSPVVPGILRTYRELERLPRGHHAGPESVHARHVCAFNHEGLNRQHHPTAVPIQRHVYR